MYCWQPLFSLLFVVNLYSILSDIVLEEFYHCKELRNQKIKVFVTPQNFNPGIQLLDINYSSPIPVGEHIMATIYIEADTQLGNNVIWLPLITLEDNVCRLIDLFIGQLMYDIEQAIGIIPKSCPVPRGTYHAINYTINYQRLKVNSFPFGKTKITCSATHKQTKEKLWCHKMLITNRS